MAYNATERGKTRAREYGRLYLYDLTPGKFSELCADQDYRCAICRQVKELHVDHDHTTDKVRGLLCKKCNTALGGFNDSAELLIAALEYLDV